MLVFIRFLRLGMYIHMCEIYLESLTSLASRCRVRPESNDTNIKYSHRLASFTYIFLKSYILRVSN